MKYLSVTIWLPVILLAGCRQQPPALPAYRVAVVQYQHETCTFCPGGDTTTDDWSTIDSAEVLSASTYTRGFVAGCQLIPGLEPVGIASPGRVFGGSSRSWNTRESFEHFMDIILKELKEKGPFDGVYLALHGALAVRDIPRPEAEIARRIRETVGPEIPVAATFDLHGNEDEAFLKWADAAFVTKRYPHYDAFRQGKRAALFLFQAIEGKYQATTATRKPPVITATVLQWTGQAPSMKIMEQARRWEDRQPGTYVNVYYGFPWSDVPDAGTTVQVITNNNQALADSIADDMAAYIWRVRESFANGQYPVPDEAVSRARQALGRGATPVVLADYADRPGDATWILEELIRQRVSGVLYACLTDSRVLEKLETSKAGVGDRFAMPVGGYTGEQAGRPALLEGHLRYFGPGLGYERVAIVDFGQQNTLIITPAYTQITTPESLRFGPLNPDEYKVFVVKSRVHFRRGFDETGYAATILVVDLPGPWFGTTRLDALEYRQVPIDQLYPFGRPDYRP